MTPSRRFSVAAAAVVAVVVSACSVSEVPLTAPAAVAERSAADANSWTVSASKGGNGSPTDVKTQTDCHTGIEQSGYMTCFVLQNATKRLTAQPGVIGKFPLIVRKYLGSVSNFALGGVYSADYDGAVSPSPTQYSAKDYDCGAECAGRLTPNPFLESAIMQFQNSSSWRGMRARLFVISEVAPMGGVQREAQVEYDSPKWSKTNTSVCTNGDYITCRTISAPDGGSKVEVIYEFGTRPLDLTLNFSGSSNYTLVRRSNPVTSGLMLDSAVESSNARQIPAGQRARYGGYRSVNDQNVASVQLTYEVGNAQGVTNKAVCEASNPRVLGCGTVFQIEVAIDQDGNPTSSNRCTAINLTSQTKFSCRQPTITSGADAVIFANVDMSDVALR